MRFMSRIATQWPTPALALAIVLGVLDITAQGVGAQAPASPQRASRTAASSPNGATGLGIYEQRAHELADRAIAGAARAEGLLPLLELYANRERVDPTAMMREIERVIAARTLQPDRRALAQWLRAQFRAQAGDHDALVSEVTALGYIRDFQVMGPFDNEGESGFRETLEAESAVEGEFPFETRYDGKGHDVGWRVLPEGASDNGFVSLRSFIRPATTVCTLSATTITSPRAQNLALHLSAAGQVRAFWNGVQVFEDEAIRQEFPDRSRAIVGAYAGPNRLVLKVCNTTGGLGFSVRVTDERGQVARGVTASSATMPAPRHGHGTRTQPPQQTAFDVLRAAGESDDASAEAIDAYARFLVYSGSDDRDEHTARQRATQAVEMEATMPRIELAVGLADERGERMRFVQMAEEHFPNDPQTRILRARLASGGARPSDAFAFVSDWQPTGADAVTAHRLRAAIYRDLGLTRAALAETEAMLALVPRSSEALLAHAESERAAGHEDEALALRIRALELRRDDINNRRTILGELLARRDRAALAAPLAELYALVRFDDANLANLAAAYESLDDFTKAESLLREAIVLAPDENARHASLGRLLLRMGREPEALASLHQALVLRPQDTETRELLEHIEDTARDDEALATPVETVLARRVNEASYPYTVLHDLTVNTVYDNGLSSSFRQLAVQVHDAEGARQFRAYGIPYEPSVARVDVRSARIFKPNGDVLEATQQVEQPMADPAYRMYYDSVNLVVVFPSLEAGDVVELRWRVDDVSSENMLANYYGDLRILQGPVPIRRLEYVLRTPHARTMHMNAPVLAGLTHEHTEGDTRNVDRFVASEVPALRREERMPGITEVSPYLHVSTYGSWEEVGRWYWGLVRDQLHPDDEMRRTVRELVADAPDVATKVRRIHDWVVDHTRYVALEFGIHGFKPYRVTQIVRRGFGDCKDKASLMFAMFREAGIEAQLVLLRTRRNGNISDLPASLAVFDHAIAYVPALDLYIDGTAEHSGLYELPEMDQGVTVLHVWPEGAALRRTPVLPADRNLRERDYTIELHADGSAGLSAVETISGSEASGVRANYEAEGTREERLRRTLRSTFPGVELGAFELGDLRDREIPATIRWNATVPRFAQADGTGLRIAPTVIDELVRMLAPTTSRNLVMDLGGTTTYRERRTITVPSGMRASQLPAGGVAESRFGRASLAFSMVEGRIVAEGQLAVIVDRVSPSEFAEYRAWVEAADRLFRQRINVEVAQ